MPSIAPERMPRARGLWKHGNATDELGTPAMTVTPAEQAPRKCFPPPLPRPNVGAARCAAAGRPTDLDVRTHWRQGWPAADTTKRAEGGALYWTWLPLARKPRVDAGAAIAVGSCGGPGTNAAGIGGAAASEAMGLRPVRKVWDGLRQHEVAGEA